MPSQSFVLLEKSMGIRFRDRDLLAQALTHRSALKESRLHGHNERMEFLGDAVLELAATEHLYHLSSKPEGDLTNWRSALVQRENLAAVARELKLGEYLSVSHGEEASGGRDRDSNLANTLEAVIGAIYLDQGFDVARSFCHSFILHRLRDLIASGKDRDDKGIFQEAAQEQCSITPHYETLSEVGPDHDKCFTCAVYVGTEKVAEGCGNSKQRAEQEAAKAALRIKGWS